MHSTQPGSGTRRSLKDMELQPEQLRWRCDPADLEPSATSQSVPAPAEGTLRQRRGIDAISFGLALDRDGFNIFVAGPPGSGRATTVQMLVARAGNASSSWSNYAPSPTA